MQIGIANETRDKLKKDLSDKTFSFKKVNKASKVAQALLLWVKAQVKFSNLLNLLKINNHNIEMVISGYTRQQIENKYNIMIPIDVQTLLFMYSKILLSNAFITFELDPLERDL